MAPTTAKPKATKSHTSRDNFWYRALYEACRDNLKTPLSIGAPDAALYLGALNAVEGHREEHLPKKWHEFAEKHKEIALKIRMAAARFAPLGDEGQLHINMPTDVKIPKTKKFLMFRYPTDEEECDYGEKVNNPAKYKQRKRLDQVVAERRAEFKREMEERALQGGGAEDSDSDTSQEGRDIAAKSVDAGTAGNNNSESGAGHQEIENGNVTSSKRAARGGLRKSRVKRSKLTVLSDTDEDTDNTAKADAKNGSVDVNQVGQNTEEALGTSTSQLNDSTAASPPATVPQEISFEFLMVLTNEKRRKPTVAEYKTVCARYKNGEGDMDSLLAQVYKESDRNALVEKDATEPGENNSHGEENNSHGEENIDPLLLQAYNESDGNALVEKDATEPGENNTHGEGDVEFLLDQAYENTLVEKGITEPGENNSQGE